MKYVIEVIRDVSGAGEEVLRRVTVDEISPRRARTRADQLLGILRQRGATAARVLNWHDEVIYRSP